MAVGGGVSVGKGSGVGVRVSVGRGEGEGTADGVGDAAGCEWGVDVRTRVGDGDRVGTGVADGTIVSAGARVGEGIKVRSLLVAVSAGEGDEVSEEGDASGACSVGVLDDALPRATDVGGAKRLGAACVDPGPSGAGAGSAHAAPSAEMTAAKTITGHFCPGFSLLGGTLERDALQLRRRLLRALCLPE